MKRTSVHSCAGGGPDRRSSIPPSRLSVHHGRRNGNGREPRTRAEPFTLTVTRAEAGFLGWVISAARHVGECLVCPLGDGYSARTTMDNGEFAIAFCAGRNELGRVTLDPRRVRHRGSSERVGNSVEYKGAWARELGSLMSSLTDEALEPVAVRIGEGNFALPRVA